MTKFLAAARNLLRGTEGASVVEYAVALLLVAIVTLAGITLLGTAISGFFTSAAGSI